VEDPPTRFTRLYDRYYRNVLGYALLRAERTTAEDVVSETFLIAWRRLGDVPDQPLPWLLGVARNLLYKQYGSHDRNRMLVRQMASLTTAADQAAWDAAEHVIERDTAVAALASLSAQDLEALTLVAWHDLDPREAAAAAGCSPATFAVRLHRARRRLTRALATGARPVTTEHDHILRRSHVH
jgi:RNA polymerase sigma factor (sigma-70 family)